MPVNHRIPVRQIRRIAGIHKYAACAVLLTLKGLIKIRLIIRPLDHRIIQFQGRDI